MDTHPLEGADHAADNAPGAAAPDTARLSATFNRTVRKAQAAIFVERLVPRLVPPACTAGLFLSASWLGLWAALPPLGCAAGVLTFAAAFLASPLLVKNGSLLVTEDEALRRLDANLGDDRALRPAQTLRDKLSEKNPPVAQKVWDLHLQDMWRRWGDKFTAGAPRPDVNAHDPWRIRYAVATATLVCAMIAGGDWSNRIGAAFNWSAPPPPPFAVKAWVTPPEHIQSAPLFLTESTRDHTQGGERLVAHKNSTMTLLVYEPEATVTVNGVTLEPQKEIPSQERGGKPARQFELPLTQEETRIVITGGPDWTLDVTPDNAPRAAINEVGTEEKRPNSLSVIYQMTDDFGVHEGEIRIRPVGVDPGAVPLPSAKLPDLNLR